MNINFPIIAGSISSIIFASSTLPMLIKAFQTRSLKSYSLTNLLMNNIGNLIHAVYVYNLPPGPLWFLHGFYIVVTGLMLGMYVRYEIAGG